MKTLLRTLFVAATLVAGLTAGAAALTRVGERWVDQG